MEERVFLLRSGGRLQLQINDVRYALRDPFASLDWLLANLSAAELVSALKDARGDRVADDHVAWQAPVETQEIWASGVTYKRSEEARERESQTSTVYTRVYHAKRPELFFKALGPEAIGSGEAAGIRADARWSVPEPELVVVFNAHMDVVGFTIGNDMSSRDIEGENPLYLPQAKVYERSCVLGPRIMLASSTASWPQLDIEITIGRNGATVFSGATTTNEIHRTLADLREYLGRCKPFPRGVLLFTGTGIVPPDEFSLQPGDEVRIRIPPIGELVNPVVVVGTGQ